MPEKTEAQTKQHPELDYGAYAPNLTDDSPMANFFAHNSKGQLKTPEQLERCARKVRELRPDRFARAN